MKIKLTDNIIKLAYKFIDVEASAKTAFVDERMIEYSFVLSRVLMNTIKIMKILDVGCTAKINPIPATLCELGHKVFGIDKRQFGYRHPNFQFVDGDIICTGFPSEFFNCISAISVLEHI